MQSQHMRIRSRALRCPRRDHGGWGMAAVRMVHMDHRRPISRSTSVIASLMRLRSQIPRGAGGSSGSHTSPGEGFAKHSLYNQRGKLLHSGPSSAATTTGPSSVPIAMPVEAIMQEGLRLLSKTGAQKHLLSDVPSSSPAFCVEVGKAIFLGAVFGASTTTGHIKDALRWTKDHVDVHTWTPRQLLSLCTPLLNLCDGATNGRRFVLDVLYAPLIRTLQSDCTCETRTSIESSEETNAAKQRRVIASAFQLIPRLLGSSEDDAASDDSALNSLAKMCALHSTATTAIARCMESDPHTYLELPDCVPIVNALQALENRCLEMQGEVDVSMWLEQLKVSYRVLLPLVHPTLRSSFANKKAGDLAGLVTVLLKLSQKEESEKLLTSSMAAIPASISTASAKDLCAVVQSINRVRQQSPELVDKATLRHVMDAFRSRIFALSSTHPFQLRALECSSLLNGLSRWEGDIADGAGSDEVVELLCQHFAAQMNYAQANNLVIFLQSLSRLNAHRQVKKTGAWGGAVSSWNSTHSVLEKGVLRATHLVREERLSVEEAAQLLLAAVQLKFEGCVSYYEIVEGLLCAGTQHGADNEGELRSFQSASALLSAIEAFVRGAEGGAVADDVTEAVARAKKLRARLLHNALSTVGSLQTPQELVRSFNLFNLDEAESEPASKSDKERVDDMGDNVAPMAGSEDIVEKDAVALEIYCDRIVLLAPLCSTREMSLLARAVGRLYNRRRLPTSAAHAALRALLDHFGPSSLQLPDAKRIIDATRSIHFPEPLPSALFEQLGVILGPRSGSRTANENSFSISFLQLLGRSLLTYVQHSANVGVLESGDHRQAVWSAVTAYLLRCHSEVLAMDLRIDASCLHELSTLAFTLSQLLKTLTAEEKAVGLAVEDGPDELHEDIDTDGSVVELQEQQPISGRQRIGELTKTTLEAVGDAIVTILEERGERMGDASTADVSSGGRLLNGKELCMLVRSFEAAGVTHITLLYRLLPEVRELAPSMAPLDVSLLMNALARLGVWNSRIMSLLAAGVMDRLPSAELAQCRSMLYGMQQSGFLLPSVYLHPKRYEKLQSARDQAAANLAVVADNTLERRELESLAKCAVARLDELVLAVEALPAFMDQHSLEDLVGVVRVLGFFQTPPQPTFDAYYALAVKKLIQDVKRLCASKIHLPTFAASAKMMAGGAITLATKVHQMRRYDHRLESSRALSTALQQLNAALSDCPSDISTTCGNTTLPAGWRLVWRTLPEAELAKFQQMCVLHRLLYDVELAPGDALHQHRVVFHHALQRPSVQQSDRRVCSAIRVAFRYSLPVPPGGPTPALLPWMVELIDSFELTNSRSLELVLVLCGCLTRAVTCDWKEEEGVGTGSLASRAGDQLEVLVALAGGHTCGYSDLSSINAERAVVLLQCHVLLWRRLQRLAPSSQECRKRIKALVHVVLIGETRLHVSAAADLLLAYSIAAECPSDCLTDVDALLPGVMCAARVLTSQLQKVEPTGHRLLPEVYRLFLSAEGCFVRWVLGDAVKATTAQGEVANLCVLCEEVLFRACAAILRFARAAEAHQSARLSQRCAMELVACVRSALPTCLLAPHRKRELTELLDGIDPPCV